MYSPEFLKPKGFTVNRAIQEEEREHVLKVNEQSLEFDEDTPHYQLSVIQINSTFVEITDRDYPVRGIFTTMAILTIIGMSWLMAATFWLEFNRWETIDEANRQGAIGLLAFVAIVSALFIAFSLYAFFRESFSFTHRPIRLNRKTRKVYGLRRNGTVWSVDWDKVYFFIRCYQKTGTRMWDIVGHILDDDRSTIKESFALSSYTSSDAIDLRLHWEYFRRYMENGPEQPYRMLKICLPLANRRETWWEGFMRLTLLMHGSILMQVLMTPFNLPASLGRLIAMRTSKIPRWPDWVEQECMVAKDDPYVRESGYEAPREYAKAA